MRAPPPIASSIAAASTAGGEIGPLSLRSNTEGILLCGKLEMLNHDVRHFVGPDNRIVIIEPVNNWPASSYLTSSNKPTPSPCAMPPMI